MRDVNTLIEPVIFELLFFNQPVTSKQLPLLFVDSQFMKRRDMLNLALEGVDLHLMLVLPSILT
jgi:hypothetical protein